MRRAPRSSFLALVLVTLAASALPWPAVARHADTTQAAATRQQLHEAHRAQAAELGIARQAAARAAQAGEAERRLGAARVAAAARVRQTEIASSDLGERLEQLENNRRDIEVRIRQRAAEMALLLPVIERLSRFPAETLLAAPADPDTALTGVLVLRGLARQLEDDAAGLRREQRALEETRVAIAAQTPRLAAAQAAQAAQATELDRELAAAGAGRRQADAQANGAARHAAELSARAETLQSMIVALEDERRRAEALSRAGERRAERGQRKIASARSVEPANSAVKSGSLLLVPVVGAVVRRWGDPGEGGPSTGIAFRAVAGGRVVAPCGGRVVFGQPFRSFGLLTIIDCGGGYHAVLSGLGRLDVAAGQSVQAGEPIGVMAADKVGTLYIELRNNGQAIDPAPWLRGRLSNSS